MKKTIRIGTRKSVLALFQAKKVADLINQQGYSTELIKITTTGDKFLKDTLAKKGGKGLFIKEIESDLADNRIDIAVHSLKDIPSDLDDQFTLSSFLTRDNASDIWISQFSPLEKEKELIVGTSSLRRQKQMLLLNPGFNFKILRGNIDTRIRKLDNRKYDAIVLSYAGLLRLNIKRTDTYIFNPDEMVPSVGQGVIAVESRQDDEVNQIIKKFSHTETEECARLERILQKHTGGDCFVPLGIHVKRDKDTVNCWIFLQLENREDYLKLKLQDNWDNRLKIIDIIKKKIDSYRKRS